MPHTHRGCWQLKGEDGVGGMVPIARIGLCKLRWGWEMANPFEGIEGHLASYFQLSVLNTLPNRQTCSPGTWRHRLLITLLQSQRRRTKGRAKTVTWCDSIYPGEEIHSGNFPLGIMYKILFLALRLKIPLGQELWHLKSKQQMWYHLFYELYESFFTEDLLKTKIVISYIYFFENLF